MALGAAALIAGYAGRHGSVPLIIAALVLGGFALAKLRADWIATPLLQRSTDAVLVSGVIDDVDPRSRRRAALIIAIRHVEGLAASETPRRLRLTVTGDTRGFRAGQTISGQARLEPLPRPVMPGGFDYGRALWFDGIGGTGRFIGAPKVDEGDTPFAYRLEAGLAELRIAIGQRIAATIGPGLSGFAEALITGERGTIPKSVTDSLQISGLAHVLSISGLHMSLVAGGVFFTIRALFALSMRLAVRRPIKSWAAAAALVVGLGYMLLAGADVATQRSYAMLGVMFFAVMVNRPALSMRNLAIAALLILVTQPESVLSAGFQMSFLAVAGLVAFHSAYARWRAARAEVMAPGPVARLAGAGARALFGLAAATLVAGTLSSIPAAYHFGRVAPLSLLGNLLALPVISLAVMPMALLSVLAMPFGLDAPALYILELSLNLVMVISDWVAHLPGAKLSVAAISLPAVLGLTGGALWLCLGTGRLRLLGLSAPLLALGAQWMAPAGPDILIDGTASAVAARGEDGALAFADARKGRFAALRWLAADGDDATLAAAAKRAGWHCEAMVCRASVKSKRVVVARAGARVELLCGEADILIAAFPLRGACRGITTRIDRFDVWRAGAHALWIGEDGGVRIRTARDGQGARPWTVERQKRLGLPRPTPAPEK